MTDRGFCPNEQINIVELQTRVLALSCQRPPAPPDVSAAAVSAHQCDFKRVIVSVFSLGGPHIKVQFQALHLMVMALPDANRDTAQVSDIDLGTYHGAHLGKIGVRRLTEPLRDAVASRAPGIVTLRKAQRREVLGLSLNINIQFPLFSWSMPSV